MSEKRSMQRLQRGHREPLTIVAAIAALVMGFVLLPGANVTASAQAATDPTIVVHAGGVRVNNTNTVGPLPDGAVFTATAVDDATLTDSCTTSGGTGTCSITVPAGHQWDVTETSPPTGYYLNPVLATGGPTTTQHAYAFRTAVLTGTTTVDVPAATPNVLVMDANRQQFSGLFATSLNDPPPLTRCGLNIALVLDQSGSMAGAKQTELQTAATDVVTALTGTPSTIAIFTFASTTGPGIGKTSTINATSAQPLINFINALPTPVGGTNWDQGLGQVTNQGFDLVIFLTDGAPTFNRLGGAGNSTAFGDLEQAIFSANALKSAGTRIVGIGIGLPASDEVNLRSVTGTQLNSDFFLADDASFGEILRMQAAGACLNELIITKLIEDSNGNLITPTPPDANGILFSNTISNGSTIAPTATTGVVNGTNGVASAAVNIPAGQTPTVTVTESPSPGHTSVGAECFVAGVRVPSTDTISFTAQAGQTLLCTFTDRRNAEGILNFPSPGGPVGTTISNTAILTGGLHPTGTVTFSLFGPGDTTCSGTPVFTSTNTLTGGTATSGEFTARAVGTFSWVATYNGDANNPPVSTACTPVTITP